MLTAVTGKRCEKFKIDINIQLFIKNFWTRGVPWILGLAPGILDQTCNFGLISLIKAKSPIRELPPIKRGSVLILHFWIQP